MRVIHCKEMSPINNHLIDYPTPANISYLWSFGSLSGMCLIIQLVTGIFLAMHYAADVSIAFSSVEHIMRDVNAGWLIRYMHANGASFFFLVVYIHIARGLYYGSYLKPRQPLWISGVVIFILMMGTAFIGYVLPWGQMSLWGATVITNLASAIPVIGHSIVQWLWGGFSVDNATLNRFYSLHYLLPFILAALSLVHLYLLHLYGSNNPLGINASGYSISFYPYLYVKDLYSFVFFCLVFGFFIFYCPNLLGHSDNYIPGNPLVTPPHIVPEWYFLPYYAILRSIPDKLGGVVAMGLSLVILILLCLYSNSSIRSSDNRPIGKCLIYVFYTVFLILGWVGGQPVEAPYVILGQCATFLYFFILIVGLPVSEYIESQLLISLIK